MLLRLLQELNKKMKDDKQCWLSLTWLSLWHYKASLAVNTVTNTVTSINPFLSKSNEEVKASSASNQAFVAEEGSFEGNT